MKLSDLLQNPLNRKIDRAKVAEIKRAIKTSGVIKPLVYTEVMTDKGKENMLTDGHHRYVALKEMGYKDAPVVMSDERGIDTAQFQDMKTVKKAITALRSLSKHLQGQHDQSKHSPTGRGAVAREWRRKPKTRREARVRGGIKGGAIHLGTIAIPAVATAAIIRGAASLRFGIIGAGAALVIYEAPQFAFRVIEGSVRERKEFERESRRVNKADGQTDNANRPISRGDHLLVRYKGKANIGVYIGGDKARLINGPKFEDVRTSKHNRLKIASGKGVPGIEDIDKTKRILRQVKREQSLINQTAQKIKERQVTKSSVDKHTPGGKQHDQKTHAPKSKGKKFIAQLRPAIKSEGKVYAGKRGQLHVDIFTRHEDELERELSGLVDGFVDDKGNFLTRSEAERMIGVQTAEDLIEIQSEKFVKHGTHNQQDHDPTKRKGKFETRRVKQLRAQLRPAMRSDDKIYAGKRGQIHADILNEHPDIFDAPAGMTGGFVDNKGKFYTRDEALNLVDEGSTEGMRERTLRDRLEDLKNKVTKHTPGGQGHDQQRHDPTKGRGQGAYQQSARSRLRGSSKFKQLRQELSSLASDPNKPGNKERMDEIQQQLAEQAREARGEIRQEPKPAITSLNDVKNHLSRGTKVLLSAERSNLPTKQNTQRTVALREELRTIGSDIQESDSKYGGIREKGFVVSISPKTLRNIKQLVQKYNQDSVIVIQDDKAELRYSDGRTEYADVSETRDVKGADDDYSSIGGVKFTIPFKDRARERKRKMIKNVDRLRDLLTKTNRLTKEGVVSTRVSGLALSRDSLQGEIAHSHPGRVKKHTPGGQQHDQQSHAPKSAQGRATANLIQGIRPAIKYEGRIFAGEKGDTHYAIRSSHAERPSYQEVKQGFVDARGDWMERDELAGILGSGWGTSEDLMSEQEKLYNRSRVEKYLRGDYKSLAKDLAEEQERLDKVEKHAQHNQQDHDPTKGRGGTATASKSGFLTAFKNREGTYVEIFKNPSSKKDLRDIDSWEDQGAVRGFLTESGDLIYWDARALHHEVRMELGAKEVVPLLIGQNYVYVTDNLRVGAGDATDFKGKLIWAGKILRRHKAKLASVIGEFQIDHYGADIDGNVIRQPYKHIRKARNHWLSLIGQDREAVMKLAEQVEKAQKKKGWATQDDFSLSEKMDMDEGVNTKRPYKNPDGAQVEGGRVSF